MRCPETSDQSHSAYAAKPSCSQMSRQAESVRLLPNHWCASSCAISRSFSQAGPRWLVPNTDMPCASIGISSSSAATTTVYWSNG